MSYQWSTTSNCYGSFYKDGTFDRYRNPAVSPARPPTPATTNKKTPSYMMPTTSSKLKSSAASTLPANQHISAFAASVPQPTRTFMVTPRTPQAPTSPQSQIDTHDEPNKNALDAGKIIVWKAASTMKYSDRWSDDDTLSTKEETPVYIKLEVPADADRVSPEYGDKCRVSKAKVLEIFDKNGKQYNEAYSRVWGADFKYAKGQMVYPDSYDKSSFSACSNGIHCHKYQDQCDQWF